VGLRDKLEMEVRDVAILKFFRKPSESMRGLGCRVKRNLGSALLNSCTNSGGRMRRKCGEGVCRCDNLSVFSV